MSNILRLLNFKVSSFARIDKESPVLIVWPEGVGAVTVLEGDQAVGKTSVIKAFETCCGLPVPDNAINKKDNDRRAEFEFERNEKRYKVSLTKTRFEVELLVDNAWAKLSTPKSLLLDILGPVGVSPMFLKEYDSKKQIEWLRSFYQPTEEQKAMEKEIDSKYKEAYASRRDVDRDKKRIDDELNRNPYFIDRYTWEAKLNAPVETVDVTDVQKRYDKYQRAKFEVEHMEAGINSSVSEVGVIDNEIAELQDKLRQLRQRKEEKELSIVKLRERMVEGQKYLETNKSVVDEHNKIQQSAKEQAELAKHKIEFANMVEKSHLANHLFEEYNRLEGKIDELRKAKKMFIAAITPEVPGLEVAVPDEDEKREGLFYNGLTPLELSESELWVFYFLLLQALNIKIVLIENIANLGSEAVGVLNKFIEAGGYVMASQMKRPEKNLKVIVNDKIIE